MKLTPKQHSALKYIRAARPLVGHPRSACPAPVIAVLKRHGLVEEKNTGHSYGVVLAPTAAGETLLIELRKEPKS